MPPSIAPTAPTAPAQPALRWDIFCQVIDNYGDIGVCWRLAAELGARGHTVRLWVDEASALAWMAPQGAPGVEVRAWADAAVPAAIPTAIPATISTAIPAAIGEIGEIGEVGDVVVEAFGCEIAPEFIAAIAHQTGLRGRKPLWINLEYLSAEGYVARCHRLPSPLMHGPGAGLVRWFFYPGFTPGTGGLLREGDLAARQAAFDASAWRAQRGLTSRGCVISLFCYEPPVLGAWLDALPEGTQLLLTPGRASAGVQRWLDLKNDEKNSKIGIKAAPDKREQLSFLMLPAVAQPDFDAMLWACDVNFVRGEDSLVRALWAGAPLVWHIYPQDDGAHHAKLQAFLDWLQAPASLRDFHAWWNGAPRAQDAPTPPALPAPQVLAQWRDCVQAARARLWAQEDLITQLLGFIGEKS